MKHLVVCLIVLIGVQSSEILDTFMEQSTEILHNLQDMAGGVLSEDGSEFTPQFKTILSLVESQLCPEEEMFADQCDPDMSWLLGCSCKAEFAALEDSCGHFLCDMVRCMKENGPKALRDFTTATTYTEMFEVLMEQVEKVWRILCNCRGLVDATLTCAGSYDGKAFDLAGADRQVFDDIIAELDLKTIGEVLHGYLDAICGEENGEDCLKVFRKWQVHGGVFYDNTINRVDSCLSMVRVEKELGDYLEAKVYEEGMDVGCYFKEMVEAYMRTEDKLICDADCAGEMQEALYSSCCVKRAGERLSSKSMKKKYVKLVENHWSFLFEAGAEAPNVKKSVDRFMSMYRPAAFCGDSTDVYKKQNEKCVATTA